MVNRRQLLKGSVGVAVSAMVAGCGGSADDSSPTLRLLNLVPSLGDLDLYSDDTRVIAAVEADSVSGDKSLDSGTLTLKLKRNGSSTTLLTTSRSLSDDTGYTLVAYQTRDTLKSWLLTEDEDSPDSGVANFRVVNLSPEAGTLDVFLTDESASLTGATADISALAGERTSATIEVDAGTYRVRVTANGDSADLRLDIPSLTLGSKQTVTLLLSATGGGVLVHGHALVQDGALTVARNTSARVRVIADTTSGVVAMSLGGTAVASSLRAPAVGSYTLVSAGAVTPVLTVDGAAIAVGALTLEAGSDTTLAVTGAPGAAVVYAIADDNRPSATSTYARLRLVHGVNGLDATLSMTLDYAAVASEVAFGGASTPQVITAASDLRLEVTNGGSSLYSNSDVTLQAGQIYTLFMLGDATSPVAVLRRDR